MRLEGLVIRIFKFQNKRGEDVYRLLIIDSLGDVHQVITKSEYTAGDEVDMRVRASISEYKGNRSVVLFEV